MQDKNKILQIFSKNLKAIRFESKLTQIEAAMKSDIDRSLYQKYESSNPPDIGLYNLYKLAETFNIDISLFLKDNG